MSQAAPSVSRTDLTALALLFSAGFLEIELVSIGPLTLSTAEVAIAAFAAIVFGSRLSSLRDLRSGGWVLIGWLLLTLAICLSAVFTDFYRMMAVKSALRYVVGAALLAALATVLRTRRARQAAFTVMAVSTAVFSVLAVVEHFRFEWVAPLVEQFRRNVFVGLPTPVFFSSGVILQKEEVFIRSGAVFLHANMLGYFIAMASMFLVAALPERPSRRVGTAAAAALTLNFYALTLTYSRGALMALAVPGFLIAAVSLFKVRGRWRDLLSRHRRVVAIAVIVIGLAVSTDEQFVQSVQAVTSGRTREAVAEWMQGRTESDAAPAVGRLNSFTSRIELWKAAAAMWRENPVFGVGSDNFRVLFYRYLDRVNEDLSLNKGVFHAHNLFLNVLAEHGLAGIATLLFLLGIVAWKTVRAFLRHGATVENLGLAGAFLAFLLGNVFDMIFYNYAYLILILTLFTAIHCASNTGEV